MTLKHFSTGQCRMKTRFKIGRGSGLYRKLRIPFGKDYTPWLPVHIFLIEHNEFRILVDTGETCAAKTAANYPPMNRWFIKNSAVFRLQKKNEAGPLLEKAGISPDSLTHVIPTHLHQDHMDGMSFFANKQLYVHRKEYSQFSKPMATMSGYMKDFLPKDFSPNIYNLDDGPFQNFPATKKISSDGKIRIVGIPGHSAGHIGLLVRDDYIFYLFSGDLAFTQQMLLDNLVDGVCYSMKKALKSYSIVKEFARNNKLVFLPSHDRDSARRLEQKEHIPLFGLSR